MIRRFLQRLYGKYLNNSIRDFLHLNCVCGKIRPCENSKWRPKVALIAIAKDEDHYIEEWIDYHIKLGVDEVFVYQNDWRVKQRLPDSVHLIEFDGNCRQLGAYDDFIVNRSHEFDFGIFIDIDEYVCLPHHRSIKEFLAIYADASAIGLNWRFFGDSGLRRVENDDYSILSRFVRCARKLNPHIKTIVNFKRAPKDVLFASPHHVCSKIRDVTITTDFKHYIHGPYNRRVDGATAWLNHYRSKTFEEFVGNKRTKGRCDLTRSDPQQITDMKVFYSGNHNEVVDTTARDFYLMSTDV